MTYEEIINKIVASNIVPRYVRFYGRGTSYREDITAELLMLICAMPHRRLTDIYNRAGMTGVYSYIAGFLNHQLRSRNSKIYYKYVLHINKNLPAEKIWGDDDTAPNTQR